MLNQLKFFLTPITLDNQAKRYLLKEYLKHAAMTVKYALATAAVMIYFEWRDSHVTPIVIWGVGILLLHLGRYAFATKAISTLNVRYQYLFYVTEVLSAVWWVAFLFLMGADESVEMVVLWRGSVVFIIVVFYLDTMRYSKFALLVYSLTICIGICTHLYAFTLIPDNIKFKIAVMLVFGVVILLMFARSSYLFAYETYQVIEQNKRLVLKMDDMLIHDELTKQHNRRYFDTQLSRYFSLFRRSGQHFCVAMVDIDYFKRINDLYGHAVGDAVLVALSAYIKDALRTSDIFARYGGEEFVILLPMTNSEESVVMLDRLRATVAAHVFKVDHLDIVLTISIGVAMVQGQPEELLEYADNALYQAKDGGRNKVVLFGG